MAVFTFDTLEAVNQFDSQQCSDLLWELEEEVGLYGSVELMLAGIDAKNATNAAEVVRQFVAHAARTEAW